jgi:hypothetical protein
MTGIDPTMAAALDSLTPPPMSKNFADRVMAATQAAPPLPTPRTTRRGGWARRHGLILGLAGFSLLSAAAAATGVLGESMQNLPVISVIAERIAPKPKAKPKLVVAPKPPLPAPAKAVPPSAQPVVVAPAVPVIEPLPVTREEVRREVAARLIAEKLAKREAWRREHGLAGPPRHLPPRLRERLRALPPPERRALIERVRQIRQEQESGSTPPPERAAIIERAEQVRQLRQRRKEWLRRRMLREQEERENVAPVEEAAPLQN